jgi:hypothetical protein
MGFQPDIYKLSQLPEGSLLAVDLTLYLGECSFSKDKYSPNCGCDPKEKIVKRVYNEYLDDTLLRILETARKEVAKFKPRTQLVRLKESIDYLAEYKIETCFPNRVL